MFQTLTIEKTHNIATITLDRPGNANSLDLLMAQELFAAGVACDHDPDIRAVILTGKGKIFCPGGDLVAFHSAGENLPTALTEMAAAYHNAISVFARMDAPLIGAVNGIAAGGGLSLTLMCDYVLAAESAKFTMAYTKAGLSPDGSATFFLAKHVGLLRAKEMMLTNRVLSAEEALQWGIVNRIVDNSVLLEQATELAKSFAQGPTKAFGSVKRLLLQSYHESLEAQMQAEAKGIVSMAYTKDAQTGIAAFLKKEKPVFKGD